MADEPNTETETARFLAWLRPPGDAFPGVTLTAIPAEGGRTTTETHFDAKAGAGWIITEDQMMIEPKGVDAFAAPNRLKVIIASNDEFVVEASADERRYAVFHVSPHLAKPPSDVEPGEQGAFWRDLNRELEAGGIEAFLYDLLALDLGDWHPRYDVPQSGGLIAQKAATLPEFAEGGLFMCDVRPVETVVSDFHRFESGLRLTDRGYEVAGGALALRPRLLTLLKNAPTLHA